MSCHEHKHSHRAHHAGLTRLGADFASPMKLLPLARTYVQAAERTSDRVRLMVIPGVGQPPQ